jgi:MFS family permease
MSLYPMIRLPPTAFVIVMFLGQLSAMGGFSTIPTILPDIQAAWQLTNTEAGFLNGVFFFGLAATTPILTGLTDRIDPKLIYLWSMVLSGVAQLGFAFASDGLISGSAWRTLHGIGYAGTYMPGLRAISDAVPDHMQSRAVAIFTSTAPSGTGVSFFLSGLVATTFDWRMTVAIVAAGTTVALAVGALFLTSAPPRAEKSKSLLPDVRPAFANRNSLGHIVAYFGHQLETSTTRSFAVVFLLFAIEIAPPGGVEWAPTVVVGIATILCLPAILAADHLSTRFGRHRLILLIMICGAICGVGLGASLGASYTLIALLMILYGISAGADGGLINAGLIASTSPQQRGGVMAAHSAIGFTGAVVGPVVFGAALDLGGGNTEASAWLAGFGVIAVIIVGCAAISRKLVRR